MNVEKNELDFAMQSMDEAEQQNGTRLIKMIISVEIACAIMRSSCSDVHITHAHPRELMCLPFSRYIRFEYLIFNHANFTEVKDIRSSSRLLLTAHRSLRCNNVEIGFEGLR